MTRFQAYQWAVIALDGARERGFASDAYEGKRLRRWDLLSAEEQEAARRWREEWNRARGFGGQSSPDCEANADNRAQARQGVCEPR